MKREEFEEFYAYITIFNLSVIEGVIIEDVKENFWELLCESSFPIAMRKARETYKILSLPCNLNQLNPKVFKGEIPNPGLFGSADSKLLC
ncbi:MAG TPA: hypothetical protein VFC84_00860 [Desulfosporosinus sp.]|nr:hypothetical protein [Desulfosporosinus sp.]